jgi:hypothetical protein
MKVYFSFLFAVLLATSALAQGRVRLVNDSIHLVFWNPNCDAVGYPGSSTFAGHAYRLGDGGVTLRIEFWAGTSPASLTRQATISFSGQSTPGTWVGQNLTMPSVPAGTNYFQISIYDDSLPPDSGTPLGYTPVFTAVASGGTPYYLLNQHIAPSWSTWPDGTYPLDSDAGPGTRGSIMLSRYVLPDTLPTLSIQPSGPGEVTIDWDTQSYSTFHLQVNSTLTPDGWTDARSGTNHPVTLPSTGSAQFYRLIQRCP